MSDHSIKKIYEWLEAISNKTEDNNKRLVRIENAVLGGEDGDFVGHKQRINYLEIKLPELQSRQRELSERIKKVYWTAAGILAIITIIATIL